MSWRTPKGLLIETAYSTRWQEPVRWIRVSGWRGKLNASRGLLEPIPDYVADLKVGDTRRSVTGALRRLGSPTASKIGLVWKLFPSTKLGSGGGSITVSVFFDRETKLKSLEWSAG